MSRVTVCYGRYGGGCSGICLVRECAHVTGVVTEWPLEIARELVQDVANEGALEIHQAFDARTKASATEVTHCPSTGPKTAVDIMSTSRRVIGGRYPRNRA